MDKQLLRDIVQWDVTSWSKAILFWNKTIDWAAVNTCLEVGAREGGLSLWIALKGKQVICSDLSISGEAQQLHAKYKVADKIQYEAIDATGIPYENYFDVIIFKSVLGGIGRNNNYALQERAINEMYKALKPDGKLLFAENLSASFLHTLLRKIFRQWGGKWRYLSLKELNQLFNKFSSKKMQTSGFLALFGRSERQRNALAVIDQKIFNKIVPSRWQYIAYGIAIK